MKNTKFAIESTIPTYQGLLTNHDNKIIFSEETEIGDRLRDDVIPFYSEEEAEQYIQDNHICGKVVVFND